MQIRLTLIKINNFTDHKYSSDIREVRKKEMEYKQQEKQQQVPRAQQPSQQRGHFQQVQEQ